MVSGSTLSNRMNSRLASLRTELSVLDSEKNSAGLNSTANDSHQDGNNVALSQLQKQCQTLENDLTRRQESYVRRERGYRVKIEELEKELERYRKERTDWMDEDDRLIQLRDLHKKVMRNIGNVHDRTKVLLQEQEKDLLRAFRARLFDVQSELDREKNKSNDGASVWIEKNRQLERDLEWARQMADRLERVNQTLSKENSRFKSKFKSQEEDREFLIRQLVAVKKDNTRLKNELTESEASLKDVQGRLEEEIASRSTTEQSTLTLPSMKQVTIAKAAKQSTSSTTGNNNQTSTTMNSEETEQRYREVVKRLKKLLEVERSNLRKVRTQHTRDLQQRSEVETLLRSALLDVKAEIAQKKTNRFLFSKGNSSLDLIDEKVPNPRSEAKEQGVVKQVYKPHDISMDDFNPAWRERTLEILLSQERVIELLYSQTFPGKPSLKPYSNTSQLNTLPPCTDEERSEVYASQVPAQNM